MLGAGHGSSGTTMSPKNSFLFFVEVILEFLTIPLRNPALYDTAVQIFAALSACVQELLPIIDFKSVPCQLLVLEDYALVE